jgi:hypothetical protein
MHPASKATWCNVGCGFCPYDGERCYDGGPEQETGGKKVHGPVEGGPRNCIMCRHFVTGPAWQPGLWLLGNKLSRAVSELGRQIRDTEELLDETNAITEQDGRAASQHRLQQIELRLDGLFENQRIAAGGVVNVVHLLAACARMEQSEPQQQDGKECSDTKIDTLSTSSGSAFIEIEEFVQVSALTLGGQIIPMLHSEEAKSRRSHLIDVMLAYDGKQPLSLAPFDDKEKASRQDRMSRFLIEVMTNEELRSLQTGAITLTELCAQNGVEYPECATIPSRVTKAIVGL